LNEQQRASGEALIKKRILSILDSIDSNQSLIPPTLLYNEGWTLRLVLAAAKDGIECLPFTFESDASWFSEALLYSAFLARRRGDVLAESMTHADGVVGHFQFDVTTKAGLVLPPHAKQFVVCEAKIFSPLSAGTRRALNYNQAARNVACIAETLRRAGPPLANYRSLGFCVIAPASEIEAGTFAAFMTKDAVQRAIRDRVEMYHGEPEYGRLLQWWQRWVCELAARMTLASVSWESVIDRIRAVDEKLGDGLAVFYARCLKYNQAALAAKA
jgi:hypothetical protein